MVHSTGEGPAFWVNVIKPFVGGVGGFRIPWLLRIYPFGCSMLQRGRKLQAGGWYPLGYASSPITVVIQLQIPFIFEKPRNFITLCWPIWYSVVIKRRNRRAPGDHNWVLGHIADCDVFGGINSYKARVVMGKRQEAQREKQIPVFPNGVPEADKTLLPTRATLKPWSGWSLSWNLIGVASVMLLENILTIWSQIVKVCAYAATVTYM